MKRMLFGALIALFVSLCAGCGAGSMANPAKEVQTHWRFMEPSSIQDELGPLGSPQDKVEEFYDRWSPTGQFHGSIVPDPDPLPAVDNDDTDEEVAEAIFAHSSNPLRWHGGQWTKAWVEDAH